MDDEWYEAEDTDNDSNSDLELSSEIEDLSEDEAEDQQERSTNENESIYPIWNPPTTKMRNPNTGT